MAGCAVLTTLTPGADFVHDKIRLVTCDDSCGVRTLTPPVVGTSGHYEDLHIVLFGGPGPGPVPR